VLFVLVIRSVKLSWNPTGPTRTPTPTYGMRLSCNFVNVYTIVYHVQYTYRCTRAHSQRTSSRRKARVSDKSPLTSRRAERAARATARRADFHARRTRRLLREDPRVRRSPRKSVPVSVSVSVSVPWNFSFMARDRGPDATVKERNVALL